MDIISEINKRGCELFEILDVQVDTFRRMTIEEDDASPKLVGEVCLGTFEIKDGEKLIFNEQDLLGNVVNIYCETKGMKIGYDEEKYSILKDLALRFLDVDFFNSYVNYSFIERKIFEWIVDFYNNSKAEYDLFTYLKNEADKEINTYTFYFKIQGLIIQNEFRVGYSLFTFKGVEYFDNVFEKISAVSENLKPENKDGFLNMFKQFTNTPLIKTVCKGTKGKAEDLSKKEVELSINAIRCLMLSESLQYKSELFNVDFLYMNHDVSNYFSHSTSVEDLTSHLERKNSPTPIKIDVAKLTNLINGGLGALHQFLIKKKKTELYYRIESQINLLGEINSTINLYNRVVMLISYFENILIPVTNTSSNGQTYLKNVIDKIIETDKEVHIQSVNRIYRIRDRYVHNRDKLPIDYKDLLTVKVLAIMFLLYSIGLSESLNTIEEFQLHFGIEDKRKNKG